MALSSNWQALLASESNPTSNGKNKQSNRKIRNVKKVSKTVNVSSTTQYAPRKRKNGSKIMDMVYNMNKEINKHEKDKLEGKVFEFNPNKANTSTTIKEPVKVGISEDTRINSNKSKEIGKYIAMDCEFVGVGPEGKESALARISIVNYFGHVVLDEFVKPREKVVEWRTWVSGIKPEHMKNAITFKEAQKKTADILEGRILVGHALKHDLEALMLSHPKSLLRDTSRHLPFRKLYAKGKTPSLKKLTKEVLKISIQEGEHSSVEDARATMLLYKKEKTEFEKIHRNTFN
ncbi:3'-5' exonuclease [Saccharomyces cerevisiae]|uniref:RNA exonuclease 4 n=1 Tax=Saccharomyces cerevisiae (strain Kyokai no. 7 / NBRC 101557) TaxID=721032 RepID=G2WMF5_YEASK|nr:Rex4p [Saccharomyces cerevisiae YJM1273]AJT98733.1 Rex4p [Saccharomyces cerevisiae YJM1381]AJT99714.1 Rex4p [Saccharomyces cerevisiae YJM1385]AJU01179.1 Rex4p [Saccharomyces cerevisiae YJM1388]AJU02638.1 Rex4p [Saccharomyces cerevisiae YJM1400]AJU03130.1 Rex4p [Saccharomyces cerevisiae YJM1401]AJU05605.1 Rex4p [Saccharomyces cerevisiae YJM1419]AJU06564.1 Rex4p [Saccharomyces cerevisiae YJM1434]AJU11433.1 Rex4p [Saccharomyces cerevisiae YJM1479]AJU12897.1 Rex4p [Saccharomyces cerevisiae 